jgi:divalent metal cation (Fe/Co/Zn/Cd) transporter
VNARESLFDIIISCIVLAGLVLSYFQIPYIEGCIILVISLFVFKLGAETIWTSLLVLMDANLDLELQSTLKNELKK